MNDVAPRQAMQSVSNPDRVPPSEVSLEAVVISHVFLKPEDYDLVASVIGAEHFFSQAHRHIWEAIASLAAQGKGYDTAAVAGVLRERERLAQVGGTPYLAQIADATPSMANVVQHAQVVREKWRLRQSIALHRTFAAEGFTTSTDGVQALLEEAERQLADLAHQTTDANLELAGAIMQRNLDEMRDAKARGLSVTGQSSGFADLDRKTGGLYDGDLYVLAGRPGSGKSAVATSIAANVARPRVPGELSEKAVAFFTLEMPRSQLTMRLACSESGVSATDVRSGRLSNEQWSAITTVTQKLQEFPLWIDDTAGITVLELRSRVRRLQREIELGVTKTSAKRLGLVVVDYLQLMRGERVKGSSREQEVSGISQGLKRMAKELSVPVLALSQLNRSVEQQKDKRPQLQHLRECLAGETRILNPRTGELVRVDAMKPGSHVLALDTRTLRLKPARCRGVIKTGVRETVSMTTRSGRSIRLTASHPVYTLSGWKPIGELKEGERFAVPRAYPHAKGRARVNADLARLLGYLVSNGSYKRHRSVGITMPEKVVLRDVARVVRSGFPGIVPRLHKHRSGTDTLELTVPGGPGPGKNPVINWLQALGVHGQGTPEKTTPDAVLSGNEAVVRNYLAGLFTGDGTVVKRKRGGWVVKYTSTSMQLLQEIQHMLLRCGVMSQVAPATRHTKSTCDIATLQVSERTAVARFAAQIPARGKKGRKLKLAKAWALSGRVNARMDRLPLAITQAVNEARSELGLSHAQLRYRCQGKQMCRDDLLRAATRLHCEANAQGRKGQYAALQRLAGSDLLWDSVRAIEPSERVAVYDIVVPGHHCFVANDIIVHNSGAIEQDADAVWFLYRAAYYDKGAPKGEAELNIAKQRNGPTGAIELYFEGKSMRFYSSETDKTSDELGEDFDIALDDL